jgi:hypothetical protein
MNGLKLAEVGVKEGVRGTLRNGPVWRTSQLAATFFIRVGAREYFVVRVAGVSPVEFRDEMKVASVKA